MTTTKKRVLCVDENRDDCELIKLYLGWEDIEVASTESVTQALAKAESEHFDLYIIDDSLPDGSGIELMTQIRSFDQATPILFHSTHGFAHLIEKAKAAGAQKFVEKRGDFDDVVRTIKTYLNGNGVEETTANAAIE